ncbi:MAG: hypothetical protein AB7R89_13555 [Dehalococcoidia bacterium]
MSVLQKFFSHSPPRVSTAPTMPFVAESQGITSVPTETPDDLLDYVDDGDPMMHDPGEPPHWAPESGTPAYSTRHDTGG